MISRTDTWTPGIRHGVPIDDYHAIDACSAGRLRDMGRSAAYCRMRMEEPTPDTPAMAVGSFVDALLLDPDTSDAFALKDFDARTKVGKQRRDELAAAGVRVLSEADWDRAHAIYHAVQASPWWSSLEDVWTQTTVLWDDLDLGIRCRARPDILAYAGRILCDLKVCRQAIEGEYQRRCVSLYHPQQLAWYARGLAEVGYEVRERVILAVHPEPPHEVTAYRMSAELNAWADAAVLDRATFYAECVRSQSWPAGNAEVEVPLPEWARVNEQNRVDFGGVEVEVEAE